MASAELSRQRGKLAVRPIHTAYAFGEMIGKGGYGSVFQAKHLSTGQDVAIKVIELFSSQHQQGGPVPVASTSEPAAKQKMAEFEVMAFLGHHESLLGICEAYLEAGKLFLVTELMDGDLCDTLLDRGCGFSESDTRRCLYQLLRGVAHMHGLGVIHRDIKLDNVMLRDTADISTVCL
eukprot:scaffold198878_cov31-Prasinocladus_malaysianus.AAC.1